MKTKYKPIIGDTYGRWTVISDSIKLGGGHRREALWNVRCNCGTEKWIVAYTIRNGSSNGCQSCREKVCGSLSISYFKRIEKRAKEINLGFDLTSDFLWELFLKQEQKCAISGAQLKFDKFWRSDCKQTASLDRIDSSKGYVKDNVQWVHKVVNYMKQATGQDEFIDWCKKIVEYNK